MWRFIVVIIINITLFSGLWLYTSQEKPVASTVFEKAAAEGIYHLEFTSSVKFEKDPFAMDLDGEVSPFTIKLVQAVVLTAPENLTPGQTIREENIKGVEIGKNAFLLEGSIPDEQAEGAHAFRLRIYRDTHVIADKTFWSSPGSGQVVEEIILEVSGQVEVEHPHDHD